MNKKYLIIIKICHLHNFGVLRDSQGFKKIPFFKNDNFPYILIE